MSLKQYLIRMCFFIFQIDRFVSVSKLKYYFAVDTSYVVKKLGLLVFPFTHKVCTIYVCCLKFIVVFVVIIKMVLS